MSITPVRAGKRGAAMIVRNKERTRCTELRQRGYNPMQIALQIEGDGSFGSKYQRVRRRLQEALDMDRARAIANIEDVRLELIDNQREVIRAAWLEFDRSKQEYVKSVARRQEVAQLGEDGKSVEMVPSRSETTLEKQVRVAASKFLDVVQRGWAEIAKLQGAYPPQKKALDLNLGIGGMFDALKAAEEATMPTIVDAEFMKLEGPDGGNGQKEGAT